MKNNFKYNIGDIVIYKRSGKEKKIIDQKINGFDKYYSVTTLNGQSQFLILEDDLLPRDTIYKINNRVKCKFKDGKEWVGTIKSCFSDSSGKMYYTILSEKEKQMSTIKEENILSEEKSMEFKYKPGDTVLIELEKLGQKTIVIKEQLIDKCEPAYVIEYVGFNEDNDVWTEKDIIERAVKIEHKEEKILIQNNIEITSVIKKDTCEVKYKTEKFLNPVTSMSTGSVVCCDAEIKENDRLIPQRFLEISDCGKKIRLHQIPDFETKEDFINKLELLNREIQSFINYLKNEK